MVVAKDLKQSSLYLIPIKISYSTINAVDSDRDATELWHNRLSHMSEKGLTSLVKKNLFSGLKKVFLKKCVHCLARKLIKVAFNMSHPSRKPCILDLMIIQEIYGLTPWKQKIKCWVCLRNFMLELRDKHVWSWSISKLIGMSINACLMSIANNMAYVTSLPPPPKMTQLNVVTERINTTLMKIVICMLDLFWGEALYIVVHVLNLSSHVSLDFDVLNLER